MKREVKLFYMNGCPYCVQAFRALDELKQENPEYEKLDIHMYEESRDAEIVAQHDFYYNPSFFIGEEKIYEAHPGESYQECKQQMQRALDAALAQR